MLKPSDSDWSFDLQEEENSDDDDQLDSPLQLSPLASSAHSSSTSSGSPATTGDKRGSDPGGWRVFGRRKSSKSSRNEEQGGVTSTKLSGTTGQEQMEVPGSRGSKLRSFERDRKVAGVELEPQSRATTAEARRDSATRAFATTVSPSSNSTRRLTASTTTAQRSFLPVSKPSQTQPTTTTARRTFPVSSPRLNSISRSSDTSPPACPLPSRIAPTRPSARPGPKPFAPLRPAQHPHTHRTATTNFIPSLPEPRHPPLHQPQRFPFLPSSAPNPPSIASSFPLPLQPTPPARVHHHQRPHPHRPSSSSTTCTHHPSSNRFTPPNPVSPPPPLPTHLSPSTPNPSWLEEALYVPAFLSRPTAPHAAAEREGADEDEVEVEVQMDWKEHERVYGAVRNAVKGRVRDMSGALGKEGEEEEEEEEWVKERVRRVGEGMRRRFEEVMGGGKGKREEGL